MKLLNSIKLTLVAVFVLSLSLQTVAQEKPDEVLYLDLSRYKPELNLATCTKRRFARATNGNSNH
jgi:hypothetical protein